MQSSKVIRITRETVSLETLQKYLPRECWQAIEKSFERTEKPQLDDSIYEQYFQANPTPPLTEDERNELFETLGRDFVKGHYSTAELRSFIEREPNQKKRR
jgi:hypothetical protein